MEALSPLLPFAFIMVIMYFLMIRPRKRQIQAHRSMLGEIGVGDEVVMIGGEIGTVTNLTDDEVELEIAPGVKMRYTKNAIRDRYGYQEDGESDADAVDDA